MLSLCMIVKNEEMNIDSCLSAVSSYVDEVIIVDTGSNDNTKNIAYKFTNKVYDFQWCGDFSKARNFSISMASNDWIIVLDADEFIVDFSKKDVDEFMDNPRNCNKVGRIKRISIMENDSENKKYVEKINRVFNKKFFAYEGSIHEQIISLKNDFYETEVLDVACNHVGYTKEELNRTNKLNRNINMLNDAIKLNPNDPYLYYQLGKSYYVIKDFDKSVRSFERAITFSLNYKLEYVADLIETYGYALINSEKYEKALMLEKYSDFYKNPDFNFIMGLIFMNNARFQDAIDSFIKCTKFSHGKVHGITSFLPNYNIAVIYEVLGFREKALEFYEKCGDYKLALKRRNL